MKTIAILGGSGFIASHLAIFRHFSGDNVHLLSRSASSFWRMSSFPEIFRHNLGSYTYSRLLSAFSEVKPDAIFYLVADTQQRNRLSENFPHTAEPEAQLTLLKDALRAAAQCACPPKAFVRAGSIAEYGPTGSPAEEGDRDAPQNHYAAVVAAGTHYAQEMQNTLPFPVVTARLALTYGPTQSQDFLIPSLIHRLERQEVVEIRYPQDGRDLVYVEDVASALHLVAQHADQIPGEVINISSGVAHRIADVADLVRSLLNVSPDLLSIAPNAGHTSAASQLFASGEKLQHLTGFRPKVDLEDGLSRTIASEVSRMREAVAC